MAIKSARRPLCQVEEQAVKSNCGWEEDCSDKCCYPQRRYPPVVEPPCHLTPGKMCSPSQGPCCTTECALKFGDKCRDDNGCRDSSFCDGKAPTCPPSINKPNKTVCNEEYVCFMGECTGSICLAYGLESCQCTPGPDDPPTKACELCCKAPGENQPCLSSYKWNSAPYDVPDMLSKPGTPCNDYNGYCDVFQRCREVDPSGPLATLRKLLLSEESIASFKRWTVEHWYYSSLIIFSFILILVLSTRLFGKRPDLKLKGVTIIHSSTTETVRLPPDTSGPGVTVHPAIKSKLPLKRKVRGDGRKLVASKAKKDASAVSNVNNNNSPAGKGKKVDPSVAKDGENSKPTTDSTPESSPTRKVQKKSKNISKDRKKYIKVKKLDDHKSPKKLSKNAPLKTPEDDPFGKVRNWLMNSHIDGFMSVRKSKSSPAGFNGKDVTQSVSPNPETNLPNSKTTTKADTKITPLTEEEDKNADQKVKLQVVYKPAFKFYVKLKKPETQTKVVKSKPKQLTDPAKQRALILLKAEKNSEQKIRQEKKKQRKLAEQEKKLVSERKEKASHSSKNRNRLKDVTDSPNEILVPDDAQVAASANDTENIPMGKHADQVKLIDKKEPFYVNTSSTPSSPLYENVKNQTVDLLRMTSTDCQKPLQEPILSQNQSLDPSKFDKSCPSTSEEANQTSNSRKSQVSPSNSVDSKHSGKSKKLRLDCGSKSQSSPSAAQVNLMRFPSVENAQDSKTLPISNSPQQLMGISNQSFNFDEPVYWNCDKSDSVKKLSNSSSNRNSKISDRSYLENRKSFYLTRPNDECDISIFEGLKRSPSYHYNASDASKKYPLNQSKIAGAPGGSCEASLKTLSQPKSESNKSLNQNCDLKLAKNNTLGTVQKRSSRSSNSATVSSGKSTSGSSSSSRSNLDFSANVDSKNPVC